MKTVYYILFGWMLLTEISLIMRVAKGLEEIDLPYLAAMIIIGLIAYFSLMKAISKNKQLVQPETQTNSFSSSNNPDSSTANQDLPRYNYLLDAEYLDEEVVKNEKSLQWNEILEDERTDQEFTGVIEMFLKPHNISVLKYVLNKEYYQSLYTGEEEQNKHIAPSLRTIKGNSKYIAKIYPDWFYMAFPDVIKWATDPDTGSFKILEEKLQPFEDCLEDNKAEALATIINAQRGICCLNNL